MRVLIVDGDKESRRQLKQTCESASIVCETASDSHEAIDFLRSLEFDAIVFGGNLPDTPADKLIRDIRLDKIVTPLVAIGPDDVALVTTTLDAGADDYMREPIFGNELISRLQAIVRRQFGQTSSLVTCGPMTIDLTQRLVMFNGERAHATGKEFAMLELFATRRNTVLTKEHFLAHMYDERDEPEVKIIDVFICKLRAKFKLYGVPDMIETIWGRGYIMRDPDAIKVTSSSPSLAPEMRDMIDDPPVTTVPRMSGEEYASMKSRQLARKGSKGKRIASPPLAPT